MQIRENYIKVPVKKAGKDQTISFFADGEKVMQFLIPLSPDTKENPCDYYAYVPVEKWKGKELQAVSETGERVEGHWQQTMECEKKNPAYTAHFAPVSGWLNDPCGLCYYKGNYHLFFQHNMFDTRWENMTWGHAISKDLIHWEQLGEALLIDEEGAAFTGCAIENTRGLLDCPKDAMLFFYTRAGEGHDWKKGLKFTQKVAWTVDGIHFEERKEPVIPYMVDENRDPKVYWMEETQEYYMVMFMEKHEYAILVSKDLEHWEMTQKINIPESWECPNLFPLPLEHGEKKWVFWTPDGYYLVGSFDGRIFTREQEIRRIYGSWLPYAAQTFSGTAGRTIQIPWMRMENKGRNYRSIMGAPRELELLQEEDGSVVLAGHLTEEFFEARKTVFQGSITEKEEYHWTDAGAVLLQVGCKEQEHIKIEIAGLTIVWDGEKKEIQVPGTEPVKLKKLDDMTILLDGDLAEVGCNWDTTCLSYEIADTGEKKVIFEGKMDVTLGIVKA